MTSRFKGFLVFGFFFLLTLFVLVASSDAQSTATKVPAKASHKVMKVAVFPVVHPIKTVKGFFYGVLGVVTVVTDGAERVTATIAKGAAKVDAAADKIEDASKP